MIMATLIMLALIGAGIWYFKQARVPVDSNTRRPKAKFSSFAGVQIHCGKNACASARALVGEQLLAKSAPVLPLPYCSAINCQCAYRKISDRRQESRRSMDDGIEPIIYGGGEQRYSDERRNPSQLLM